MGRTSCNQLQITHVTRQHALFFFSAPHAEKNKSEKAILFNMLWSNLSVYCHGRAASKICAQPGLVHQDLCILLLRCTHSYQNTGLTRPSSVTLLYPRVPHSSFHKLSTSCRRKDWCSLLPSSQIRPSSGTTASAARYCIGNYSQR